MSPSSKAGARTALQSSDPTCARYFAVWNRARRPHEPEKAAKDLSEIDTESGKRLRDLVNLRTASHYGDQLLRQSERELALRRATALVEANP